MTDLTVELYSGHRLADRPLAVNWRGQRWEVEQVLREWRTPDGPGFDVLLTDERRLRLEYNEAQDRWVIREFPQGVN